MLEKLIAFIMAILTFFANLFGLGGASAKCYVYQNEAYGTQERQIMDLYIPKDNDGTIGLVLNIHGGAWIEGNKDGYRDTCKNIAENYGFAAAAINYHYISDTVHMETLLEDIDAALAAIRAIGEENSVTIDKVLLTGTSAGAHLALLYAYSRAETAPIMPAAVVSFCGPTDLSDSNFYSGNAMGDTDFVCRLMSYACGYDFTMDTIEQAKPYLDAISPVSYVTENTVPTVLAHGEQDHTVPFSNAVTLDEKLTQAGVQHEFVVYPNSDHDLANDPEQAQQAFQLLEQYARTYLN